MDVVSLHCLALGGLSVSCLLPLSALGHVLSQSGEFWITPCTSSIRWLSPHHSASGKQQSKCPSHSIYTYTQLSQWSSFLYQSLINDLFPQIRRIILICIHLILLLCQCCVFLCVYSESLTINLFVYRQGVCYYSGYCYGQITLRLH